MRRVPAFALVVLLVVGAAVAGWIAASNIKSPAQVAAETEPPEPSLMTVPVELMTITNEVVTRGTVRFDDPEFVSVTSVAEEGLAPVMTRVPAVGTEFVEGDVLYEVSGRPAFVLQGELPLFRTAVLGDSGEDILQLQRALARLGFEVTEFDGIYGEETEAAVTALYESAGYEPVIPSQADIESYDAARDGYQSTNDAVDSAERALVTAEAAQGAAEVAFAEASDRVTQAESGTHPDTGEPPTPEELSELKAELESAGATLVEADEQVALASENVASSRRARSAAWKQVNQASAALSNPAPDTEFLFFPSFPIRVDSVLVDRGDIANGEVLQVSGARLTIDGSVRGLTNNRTSVSVQRF